MTLSGIGTLNGNLSGGRRISGELAGSGGLSGRLTLPDTVAAEIYKGEYEITPVFFDQNLETSGKLMTRNVTVEAIPVEITTNLQGGNTVYIGGITTYGE